MHDHKIILNADEHIVCPKCAHDFILGEGITRQTIDRHAEEFESLLQSRRAELEEPHEPKRPKEHPRQITQ